MRKKIKWILPAGCVLLLVIGFFCYTGLYYHADAKADLALVSDSQVRVTETGYGWCFDGPAEDAALVFYPGAKVEETAYAPEHLTEHVIEGGNHAQFGSYGEQKGDGGASLSMEEQIEETARVIAETVR